jgi:hypothetical protein
MEFARHARNHPTKSGELHGPTSTRIHYVGVDRLELAHAGGNRSIYRPHGNLVPQGTTWDAECESRLRSISETLQGIGAAGAGMQCSTGRGSETPDRERHPRSVASHCASAGLGLVERARCLLAERISPERGDRDEQPEFAVEDDILASIGNARKTVGVIVENMKAVPPAGPFADAFFPDWERRDR